MNDHSTQPLRPGVRRGGLIPFLLLIGLVRAVAEVEIQRVIESSVLLPAPPDTRLILPQGLSVGPTGAILAAARLVGPGIDGDNDTVLVYQALPGPDALRILLREGDAVGPGTFVTTEQATLDDHGRIAVLAELRDPANPDLRFRAVLHGPPDDLDVVEYAGRPITADGVGGRVFLNPGLRHTRSGFLAYMTGRASERILWRGAPPLTPVAPLVAVGQSYPGFPDGATLVDLDPDFLINDAGFVVFIGTLRIPAANPKDPPRSFRAFFYSDGSTMKPVNESDLPLLSLGGHSVGRDGAFTFHALVDGRGFVFHYLPGEGYQPIQLPGDETVARTGIGEDGAVLVWAVDASDHDSVWLWQSSEEEPRLIARETETDLPFRNNLTLKFDSFADASLGPGNRVALAGRATRGSFRFDGVWMAGPDGQLEFVATDAELPPFERDINGFLNGLGNGADGRRSVFTDDGRLLVRIDSSVRLAALLPPATPPRVALTMRRLNLAGVYNLQEGLTETNGVDLPLIPVPNPAVLAGQPVVRDGMVADGVSPLLFRLALSQVPPSGGELAVAVEDLAGGTVADGIDGQVTILREGVWERGAKRVLVAPGDTDHYVFLYPIRSDDVSFSDARAEIRAALVVRDGAAGAELARQPFRIRKPPVLFVHGYNSRGDWAPVFFETLAASRAREGDDFLIPIRYGQRRIGDPGGGVLGTTWSTVDVEMNLENTVLPFHDLAGMLDVEMDRALEPLRAHWAFTRHDVVAHSQGGILVRLLCAEKPPAEHLPRGFQDFTDFNRGRFHRVITLGSPHNGSLLVRYLKALDALDEDTWPWDSLPAAAAAALVSSGVLRDKFDPAGEQIQEINDRGRWGADRDARFLLIQTTVNQGEPPRSTSASYGHRLLGLDGPRGAIVLPFGSDGVVDFDSMGARHPVLSQLNAAIRVPRTNEIAHSGPAFAFSRDRANPDTVGQTESRVVAELVRKALDQVGPEPILFLPFRSPVPYWVDGKELRSIELAASGWALVRDEETGAIVQVPLESRAGRAAPQPPVLRLRATVPEAYPVEGALDWDAETYGPDGIVALPFRITGGSGDRTEVILELATPVVGDLLVYASYTAVGGARVFLRPSLLRSVEPEGLTVNSIRVLPESTTFRVGDPILAVLEVTYSDQSLALRHPEVARWTTSNPDVLDVSHPRSWVSRAPGTATVTATFGGHTAESTLTIVPRPVPAPLGVTYEAWSADQFSAQELADPALSGPGADRDGDGHLNAAEFVLAGDPHTAEPAPLLRPRLWEEGARVYAALEFTMVHPLAGVRAILQASGNLEEWTDLQDLAAATAPVPSLVVRRSDGAYRSQLIVRDAEPLGIDGPRFLRIRFSFD